VPQVDNIDQDAKTNEYEKH